MRVKCVLCDKVDKIDDHILLAKRLRNRPIHTYMCEVCHDRIATRTNERKELGTLPTEHTNEKESDWV
ncbi:YlaI family protein [Alkalihalobacillus pseudalcaliphilus]|uniref:YlaI family protein n=1 Tax=Alkalihalobacillus pseudalcaliphilus TaxID=79884 RepID=UPI00064DCC1B|nr:YlaI family protein [Alkalihalobacillus pseudalcaliphilus]KMK77076.1 hypothetical protein AB990_05865 [Alkalihalobacillus pseudalcaliphilus]